MDYTSNYNDLEKPNGSGKLTLSFLAKLKSQFFMLFINFQLLNKFTIYFFKKQIIICIF